MTNIGVYAGFCMAASIIAAEARDDVVIVSGGTTAEQADSIYRAVEEQAAAMEPGDSMTIVASDPSIHILAHVTVVEEHSRRRQRELMPALQALDEALSRSREASTGAGTDSLRLERTLFEVRKQLLDGQAPICVLAAGDSRSVFDSASAGYDMKERFFSDGLIAGSPGRANPYGTAGRETLYEGVDLAVLDLAAWPSGEFRSAVKRAWGRWIAAQGGGLTAFTESPVAAVQRWRACPTSAAEIWVEADPALAAPAMIELGSVVLVDTPPAAAVGPEVRSESAFLADDVALAEAPPAVLGGPMKLGISWSGCDGGAVDLDIYFRSSAAVPWIFWDSKQSADGTFYKDVRAEADLATNGGLEFVIVDTPDWLDSNVLVNFYEGECSEGRVEGRVRAEAAGGIYESRFAMAARAGDRGAGRAHPGGNAAWLVVDMAELLGAR